MISRTVVGWIIIAAGGALWTYGYFGPANASFVDWKALTPWWIADYLPNREAELGIALMCIGMVPLYWPPAKSRTDSTKEG